MNMKTCTKCQRDLPLSVFGVHSQGVGGRRSQCRGCCTEAQRERRQADPERFRAQERASLLHKHGITQETYDARLAEQGGLCAVCGLPPREGEWLVVDHDHECCPGAHGCADCFRGLLDGKCNRLLGLGNDNPERLEAAARYLRSYMS